MESRLIQTPSSYSWLFVYLLHPVQGNRVFYRRHSQESHKLPLTSRRCNRALNANKNILLIYILK